MLNVDIFPTTGISVDMFSHTDGILDIFPHTDDIYTVVAGHVESCVLLERVSNRKPDAKIRIDVDLEDYYRIKDNKNEK